MNDVKEQVVENIAENVADSCLSSMFARYKTNLAKPNFFNNMSTNDLAQFVLRDRGLSPEVKDCLFLKLENILFALKRAEDVAHRQYQEGLAEEECIKKSVECVFEDAIEIIYGEIEKNLKK